jgi:hypothetical protein
MPTFNGYGEEHPEKDHVGEATDKNRGSGRKKFAAAVQQATEREEREVTQRDLNRMAPTTKDEKSGIEYGQGRITEPRCHVCQHPYRDWIETMLIRGASYKGLQNRIPPLEGHKVLDRRSFSNHHKNHMDLRDAALRAILEKEAELQGQNFEEGVEDAITKRGVLEVALRKGFEDIINNVTTVEPRDLIQITKVLGEMDSHQHQIGLDELRAQVQIFIQAIKDVCDSDMQNAIAARVKELRTRENISKQIEGAMDTPALPVVVEAVVVE